MLSIMRLSNFNSIKVRLRLAASEGVQVACGFQFHKGTIKTSGCIRGRASGLWISIP